MKGGYDDAAGGLTRRALKIADDRPRLSPLRTMPTLAIWGSWSHTGTVWGDLVPIWKRYAENVTGGPIECGHYVPEEAPDQTYDWFQRFFGG